MRLTENDDDSTLSVSPDIPSEAGPSTVSLSNGHNGVAKGNGVASPFTNGNGNKKGSVLDGLGPLRERGGIARVSLPGTTLYDDSYVDREEFVRLVIQSLRDVGYIESAATLEAESGYTMETSEVSKFRQCILDGAWSEADDTLMKLGLAEDEGLWDAKFLISQQKYLEHLEARRTSSALHILRNELAPLSTDPDTIHSLSSLLMCQDPDDLRLNADGWDGASGNSRRRLLVNLQRYIPSSVMIPQRRFSTLLDQARTYQHTQCLYHNVPSSTHTFSLYADHACNKNDFPRVTTAILDIHTDEVWNLEWSHSGQFLATASKDKTAIIWRIGMDQDPATREYYPQHILREHQFAVGCVAWSLDDSILLTASEHHIKMWNTRTGLCIRTLPEVHKDVVTALAWLPDGTGFFSAGLDRKIVLWDTDGKQRDSWGRTAIRVTDLAITPDYTRMVAVGMCDLPAQPPAGNTGVGDMGAAPASAPPINGARSSENRVVIYDLITKQQEASIRMDGDLTSVKISHDSRHALINHASEGDNACSVYLMDLNNEKAVRKFTAHKQSRHVIRSCFGGVDGNFIASGSEDANVYIWHRETGTLLETLPGHGSGSVNCVAWNPRNECMFASCSDDKTIRIWEAHPGLVGNTMPEFEDYAHDRELSGKGKGKGRERWDRDGANPASTYAS